MSEPEPAFRSQDILDFWFGPDPLGPGQLSHKLRLWFGGEDPPEVVALRDEIIANRFGPAVEAAARGDLDGWAASPHRLLALILLLDQFPRHVYRGTSRAFSQDKRASALCLAGLETGADGALSPIERLFFYLPLQHAESTAIQDESIAAYRRLALDAPDIHKDLFEGSLRFADQHRQVVERFGRFPHRNAALGRLSTAAELAWLNGGGSVTADRA